MLLVDLKCLPSLLSMFATECKPALLMIYKKKEREEKKRDNIHPDAMASSSSFYMVAVCHSNLPWSSFLLIVLHPMLESMLHQRANVTLISFFSPKLPRF